MEGTCILVLGMHRSGTSAVTRALAALGVDLGDRLMPGLEDNPKGFFEDLDLTRINHALLEAMGKRWDSLLLPPWTAVPQSIRDGLVEEARRVIRDRFSQSPCWAFKDPRTVRLLPFWEQVLEGLGIPRRFLIAYRHPLSVAASLARRDGFDEGKALLLWLQHMLPASRVPRALVVDYDRLLEDPSSQFARMARFYGLRRDAEEERAFAEDFLDPSLRHRRDPGRTWRGPSGPLGRVCQGLHRLFHSHARDKPRSYARWEMARGDALSYLHGVEPLMASVDGLSLEAQKVPFLKRHIHQLEARNLELEGQVQGLERHRSELEAQLDRLFEEITALQRELIRLRHQHQDPFLIQKRGRH
ncbi:MAG: hypothetical protein D6819_07240 [Gammaproteobacteria bacterium]|nr:MAG: hypothetical protein D6819_07240 [Gammaproteobacteria bacterium]